MVKTRLKCSSGTIIALFIFLILPLVSNAQDTTAVYSHLGKGNSALQFQVNSNFTLKSFSGTLISFQKILSQKNAVRWGLSLNGSFQKVRSDSITPKKKGNFGVTITMNYLWYAHLQHRIRFYYGLGPMVSFGYQNNWQYASDSKLKTQTVQTDESVGIEGVVGVEWFVNNHISLIAEYLPLVTIQHSFNVWRSHNGVDGSHERDGTTTYVIDLRAEPVRFGVSLYF